MVTCLGEQLAAGTHPVRLYFFLTQYRTALTTILNSVSSSAPDAAAAVRNFLASLQGQQGSGQQQHADLPYPYLNHLLPTSITIPMIDKAPVEYLNTLLTYLPPAVVVMAADPNTTLDSKSDPSPNAVEAAVASLSVESKRALLKKVLRSPQFNQGLGGLTMALRDGGLPSIADALGVQVENGGYIRDGSMPLGGGHAVQAFIDGVKTSVKKEQKK